LAQPAIQGRRVDAEHRGDVSHAVAGIDGHQGSLTDVVRGMRALHPQSVPDWHNYPQPL
jgi:hypothetical protein